VDLGLAGKTALVAASSRGLGRAVAEELAAEGAKLVMCSRNQALLEDARSAIVAAHANEAIAVAADLSAPADVTRVVDAARRAFGHVDVLVTNTGGPPAGTFEGLTPEDWSLAVRQNLDSVLNLTRAVLPAMKEQRWGRIINVTSISVKQPVDNLILSNSIRAAVTGFARTLANEVAPFGITVNNVLPGYTHTQRVEELAARMAADKNISRDEALDRWASQIPMGRLGEPREFAAAVAFLASERASYMTGLSVPVDGGWVRGLY